MTSAHESADRLIAEGHRAEREGRLQDACELYRRAVDSARGYAKAHLNLGIGLEAAGDVDSAIESHETALANDPADPYANYNLGRLLYMRGALPRAERLLRAAIDHKPDFPEAHVMLSSVYDSQGKLAPAAAALEAAVSQRPDYAGAWYNYGELLLKLDRRAAAEAAFRRTIAIDPGFLPALHMLGNMLRADSQIDEALEAFAAARKLDPARFDLESMELHALNLSDRISEEALSARHRAFGARLERAFPPRFARFENGRDPERRLRIGYVSCDFNMHPVAWFMTPVLERHDRGAFETYCYSTGSSADDATRRLAERAGTWRDAAKLLDSELADTIHRDGIDVLVDLTGHAGAMRLGVFSEQPAPVQVTWLGYLNTTGLTRIHYRLCDSYTDPVGLTDHLHTETLVRLPNSQWCYRPVDTTIPAAEPPLKRNGFVTFGSFNHAPKLSSTVRSLWCEILKRLPQSRLVIVGVPEGLARDRMIQTFQEAEISASRLEFTPRVPLDQYFRRFNDVDIALDSTPYSGGTTTCDALWMGVPVVTAPGPRSVSRSAASILSTVGLSEWIAPTPGDYARLAVELSRDDGALVQLRGSLRSRMRGSPLMDETGFVRDLEGAYRRIWRHWCASGRPAP